MQRALATWLLPVLILGATSCAARYRGNVTLEEQYAPEPEASTGIATSSTRSGTQPPDCSGDLPMPEYPAALLGPEAPTVNVRVDLLLNDEGAPENVAATIYAPGEPAAPTDDRAETPKGTDLFLRAAEEAVSLWRCRPAWRYPLPDEPPEWVPLPYRTWILFRFDAERVDRKAALTGKGGGDPGGR